MREENPPFTKAGGGSQFGKGSTAVRDSKKRVELVARKAAIEQVREEFAFSQRRACHLMTVAVSSYRYQTSRSDEPLRTKLVELAREKPRFGYRRLQVLLRRTGEEVNHKRLHRVYRDGGVEHSAEETETLRAGRTAAARLRLRRTRNGRWTSCTMRWTAVGRSGCSAWWTRTRASVWLWKWTPALPAGE